MKIILGILCVLFCVEAHAVLPVYSDVCAYVEKQNSKDQIPSADRIFINLDWKDSAIVRYSDGMKLDDVLKQSKFMDKDVFIFVFRTEKGEPETRPGIPIYDSRFAKIKRTDFVIRPLDAIYLVDIRTPIN